MLRPDNVPDVGRHETLSRFIVSRSLQDKPYDQKVLYYGKQTCYAASLYAGAYDHQPKFRQFYEANDLPFELLPRFGKDEQCKRHALLAKLVEMIWSPDRLDALA